MIDKNQLQYLMDFYGVKCNITSQSETAFNRVFDLTPLQGCTLSKIKKVIPDINAITKSVFFIDTADGIQLKQEKPQRDIIYSTSFLNEIANHNRPELLPLVIGQEENGNKVFFDLAKGPHLLVGGSTGSGKSVFIHNCILSLLYGAKSGLILVDVKQVEFSMYEGIPNLATDIIYNSSQCIKMLKNLCYTMDNRYKLLKENKCRNIQEYISKGYKLDYITLIIDELADLILQNPKIEDYLIRIAQLGRAAGIHMILATQRPDSNILSGLIRANVPSRVCFAVQKATDSRIVLDSAGGERLKGNGDGILIPIGSKNPIHFQSPFTTTEAIEKITSILKKQP